MHVAYVASLLEFYLLFVQIASDLNLQIYALTCIFVRVSSCYDVKLYFLYLAMAADVIYTVEDTFNYFILCGFQRTAV